MSIVSEIDRIKTNIANAYTELETKQATIPSERNSHNLANTIKSIETGGGGWDTTTITGTREMFKANKTLIDAPYFNTENVKDMTSMFSDCTNLVNVPNYNTSKVTNLGDFLYACTSVKTFPALGTPNATTFNSLCYRCSSLETVPLLDCSKITNIGYAFYLCSNLVNIGGFKNLGKAYTQKTNNYSNYTLTLNNSNLSYESLMNVINNLYDLNISYNVANGGTLYTQKLVLGSTNISKLSASELEVCTQKGWVVS